MVVQWKIQRPVQFELTEPTRSAVAAWIETANLKAENYLFSVARRDLHISPRASTHGSYISGSQPSDLISPSHGTNSMRRTKVTR